VIPNVDVEVAYVRFEDTDPVPVQRPVSKKLGEAMAEIEVAEREIDSRLQHHGAAYTWIPGGPEAIRRHVRQEIQAARVLTRLANDVTPKTDFEALAKAKGLSFHRYRNANRNDLQVQPEVGSVRAMMMIHGVGVPWAREGKLPLGNVVPYVSKTTTYWPGIFDEPGSFLALYRLTKIHEPKE
jgi:hypothetical protein